MYEFLSGATALGSMLAGLYFFRFFMKVKDRFFLFFASAFWILALERLILIANDIQNEEISNIYFIRFVAFLIIIIAIIDKNRRNDEIEN